MPVKVYLVQANIYIQSNFGPYSMHVSHTTASAPATGVCVFVKAPVTCMLLLLTDADSAGREGSACCCAALRGSSLHSNGFELVMAAQCAMVVDYAARHAEPHFTAVGAIACKECLPSAAAKTRTAATTLQSAWRYHLYGCGVTIACMLALATAL
jgi:hypothetical protein